MKKLFLILFLLFFLPSFIAAQRIYTRLHTDVYSRIYSNMESPWENYDDYNFYVDFFRSSIDQADNLVLLNASSAGKKDYLGNIYGENIPVIEPGKGLLTYGEYTQLCGYTSDFSEWGTDGANPSTYDSETEIWTIPSISYVALTRITFTADNVHSYIVVESVSDALVLRLYDGIAVIDSSTLTIGKTIVTGTTNATNSGFIAIMNFSGSTQTIKLSKCQLTQTAYEMPYVENNTGGTVTVPKSSANADEGSKYAITAGSKLKTALYGTDGSDAQGRMIIKWQPAFDAADVSTDVNIITANDDADGLLYYDASAGMLITTNGTNLAAVSCTPVSGTLYTIEIAYDDELQISVDSTSGYAVAFNGVWPEEGNLSFGWDASAPQFVEKLYFQKESDPITDHDEEFLYTVVDTQVVAGVFSTTDEITVYWGDGNSDTYDGADQAYSHDYGSAGFHVVSVVGKSLITKLTMTTTGANVHCSLSDLPTNLTYFNCLGSNKVSGLLSDLPTNLTYFNCLGSNKVSGLLSDLPTNLTYFNVGGANKVSGLLSDLPTNLTYFYCSGSNSISGSLSDLPEITTFKCFGLNTISDYTTKTWTTKPATFMCSPTGVGGLSETEINQLLIDLDDDFDWTTGTIILTGTNAAPTGAGATAASNMDTEGATVTTN